MRSLRLSFIAVVVVAWSCGGGGGTSRPAALSSRWTAPPILSHVPADSPYLVAVLEPMDESLRRRMLQGFDKQIAESMHMLDKARDSGHTLEPWMRVVSAIMNELRGKDAATWTEQLGFDPRGKFVLYGLSVWPVVRIEIASPARLRAAIERVLTAAGEKPQQRTLDGRAYWVAGGKELSFVASVLDREAVVAVVPTGSLDAALPLVLGTRMPERSLAATDTVPELFGRHRFLGVLLAYVDARNLVDSATRPGAGPFDAPLRAATGPISPACRADLDRLAVIAPRLVLGYRRIDQTGFEASAVVETAPGVVSGLRKLHTSVPEVTAPLTGHPMFALGAAVDPRQLVAWLQGVTQKLHDHPFACPWFSDLNEAGRDLADKLAQPLPPTWLGVRGFSMVVDDVTSSPLAVAGHVLVAGDRIADLVSSVAGAIPWIAGIPLARNGQPMALPIRQLQLPVASAHLALTTDRLVIAAGENSERRATEHLAAPAPRSSPLALMAFDVPRLQSILAKLGEHSSQTFGYVRDLGISLDLVDEGVALDMWGTWAPASPSAPTAP
ncbi:MAG TPA: hypothetical protein VF469_35365 [Kofleriaceae bacterium]